MSRYFEVKDILDDQVFAMSIGPSGDLFIDMLKDGLYCWLSEKEALKLAKKIIKAYKKENK
tara:strand:- start:2765 stop:2947 length:183 start_codon:yes stop_codon:yes gene_type:complete